jgi:hypothetical protein
MARRNPYRPGSASYAQFRETLQRRRATLASARATRAKTPETRRRAQRQAAAAARELRAIEARQEFRCNLNERDRMQFDRLSLTGQDRLRRVLWDFPEDVPSDVPDPFVGARRSETWRLCYATRAGIRQRAAA